MGLTVGGAFPWVFRLDSTTSPPPGERDSKMIKWREAYDRLKDLPEFRQYFNNKLLSMAAFRFLAYAQRFEGVAGSSTAGTLGPVSGPLSQNFPAGAVVLGITAGAYQSQQLDNAGVLAYAPSYSSGRRDLFALSLQYSTNEQITPNGLTMAEPLLGSGYDTIFPGKELLIAPSQSVQCSVAAFTPSTSPDLTVQVIYHCMVPRAAN